MEKTAMILSLSTFLIISIVSVSVAGSTDISVDIVVDKKCMAWLLFKNVGSTTVDHKNVPYNTFYKDPRGSWKKIYGSLTGIKLNPGQEMALPFKPAGYTLLGKRTLKANVDPGCAVLGETGSACSNNEKAATRKCARKSKLMRRKTSN